jgi:glycosyltransferase involved in cell wall biosynthesis
MPLISIITINLNNKNGLSKTIESVAGQRYLDFEYIVIDGGSIDGSVEIITSKENFISRWISEPDHGIYHAMNKGILASKGKYLLFLNSGDVLMNEQVLHNVSSYLSNHTPIVFGNITFLLPDGRKQTAQFPRKIGAHFLTLTSLPHPSSFILREIILRLGLYDESYKIAADYAFFTLAILKHKCPYRYVNMNISCFDTNGISSDSSNEMLLLSERKKALRKAVVSDYLYYYLWISKGVFKIYFRVWWKIHRFIWYPNPTTE